MYYLKYHNRNTREKHVEPIVKTVIPKVPDDDVFFARGIRPRLISAESSQVRRSPHKLVYKRS